MDAGAGSVLGFEDAGTCWKALVTSLSDILNVPVGGGSGGVPPSDLTSCIVKGCKAVKSSAIPSREFDAEMSALSDACDQTAFKCSGSGARAAEPLERIALDTSTPGPLSCMM